jgi:hypothetical protein
LLVASLVFRFLELGHTHKQHQQHKKSTNTNHVEERMAGKDMARKEKDMARKGKDMAGKDSAWPARKDMAGKDIMAWPV